MIFVAVTGVCDSVVSGSHVHIQIAATVQVRDNPIVLCVARVFSPSANEFVKFSAHTSRKLLICVARANSPATCCNLQSTKPSYLHAEVLFVLGQCLMAHYSLLHISRLQLSPELILSDRNLQLHLLYLYPLVDLQIVLLYVQYALKKKTYDMNPATKFDTVPSFPRTSCT